jgi:hypothetical protein
VRARARVVDFCREHRLPLAKRTAKRDGNLAGTRTIFTVRETDFTWLNIGLSGEVYLERGNLS